MNKVTGIFLGIVTLVSLAGVIILTALSRNVPDVLTAVLFAGTGALAGVALPTTPGSTPQFDASGLVSSIVGEVAKLLHLTPTAPSAPVASVPVAAVVPAAPLPAALPATDTPPAP